MLCIERVTGHLGYYCICVSLHYSGHLSYDQAAGQVGPGHPEGCHRVRTLQLHRIRSKKRLLGLSDSLADLLLEAFPVLSPLLGCIYVGWRFVVGRREHRDDAEHDRLDLCQQTSAILSCLPGMLQVTYSMPRHSAPNHALGTHSCTRHPMPHVHTIVSSTHRLNWAPSFGCCLIPHRIISRIVQDGDAHAPIAEDCMPKKKGCRHLKTPWNLTACAQSGRLVPSKLLFNLLKV
jgi:hypothetical protein